MQLLQQQQQQHQYLAQQQQQAAAAAAAFPQPPYVLNPQQEQPYLITSVPPYYGVAPWVYPAHAANLIQQGASNGARRPLTPNGTAEAQQQVQVEYCIYHNKLTLRNLFHLCKFDIYFADSEPFLCSTAT